MKSPILLLAFSVLALASCTTAYKTGQTPDDVYYSAARPQKESDDRYEKEERRYAYDDEYYDDRYLRMKIRNRYRWNDLDDWYFTDRYSIGYNYYYGSFNNPYNRWNYYYNPFCCCLNKYNYVFVNPKTPAAQPAVKRPFNLASYTNTAYNNNNSGMLKTSPKITTTKPVYNNTNTRTSNSLSDKVRTIFDNDNSGNRSTRTYNPSSSSGSSGNNGSRSSSSGSGSGGSSGGSSGGGVSRPTRN